MVAPRARCQNAFDGFGIQTTIMSTERTYSPGKRLEAVQETLVALLPLDYIAYTNGSEIEGV